MKLFYSGAIQKDQPQPLSELSLGGYISSTPIGSGILNNVFSNQFIPQDYVQQVEYKAIFLRNILNTSCTNVYIYYNYSKIPSDIKLEIGVMTPNSKGEIERIPNSISPPLYQQSFAEMNGIENKGLIAASLATDEYIGLWLKKTYLKKQQDPDKVIYENWLTIAPIIAKFQNGETLTEEEQDIYNDYYTKINSIEFNIEYS